MTTLTFGQQEFQKAHMVCSMDWNNNGNSFYDSWVSRTIKGDMFVEIPQTGSFEFANNLFWNDAATRELFEAKLPFQVYACWSGGAIFTARPLLKYNVTFRASYKDECYMGEPTLFCKDFWNVGYGRIAVIPSVNVGYNDHESRAIKKKWGWASNIVWNTEKLGHQNTEISWRSEPPDLVKCLPFWNDPSWVPWDQGKDQIPFDWRHSGYFNADRKEPENSDEDKKDPAFDAGEDDKADHKDGNKDNGDGDGDGDDEDSKAEEDNGDETEDDAEDNEDIDFDGDGEDRNEDDAEDDEEIGLFDGEYGNELDEYVLDGEDEE